MKSGHLFGTVTVAFALLGAACSSSKSDSPILSSGGATTGGKSSQTGGTGGGGQGGQTSTGGKSTQTGGTSGGGQGGTSTKTCSNTTNVVPCGGSVVGTWTVTPSCLAVSGERNVEAIGLGCLTMSVKGTVNVSGSWIANADGTYTNKTITTGEEELTLVAKCREVSGTVTTCERLTGTITVLGYEKVTCVSTTEGGCSCLGTINQQGGIGLLSGEQTGGDYKVSNNVIATGETPLTREVMQYSYCVSGNKMNWTPKVANPTFTGSIEFQKSGNSGTGGTSGSGGSTSSGGATASGGTTSSGGSTITGGTTSSGGNTGGSTGGTTSGIGGPCDIYETAKTPCVGAYSTVRALYKAYSGPLYQVRSKTNKTSLMDVPLLAAGGYVNSKVQDDFCGSGCTIAKLYDQSPKKNDLPLSGKVHWLVTEPPAGPSQAVATESNATAAKATVNGHTVYGVRTDMGAGNSYRVNAKGTAVGDEPEAMYMVVDTKVKSSLCCYDFGNASTTGNPDGEGTMETIYYGDATQFGQGGGKGPWLMADLEFGIYPSDKNVDPSIPSLTYKNYATLLLNGFTGNRFALKAGDAQTGPLQTTWDGKRPPKYSPMKKQGAIVLGTGGDGSFLGSGVFFEGAITFGCPDDKTVDDAIQANIVAAGYGK